MTFVIANPPPQLLDEDGRIDHDKPVVITIDLQGASIGIAHVESYKDGSAGCYMCGLSLFKKEG